MWYLSNYVWNNTVSKTCYSVLISVFGSNWNQYYSNNNKKNSKKSNHLCVWHVEMSNYKVSVESFDWYST